MRRPYRLPVNRLILILLGFALASATVSSLAAAKQVAPSPAAWQDSPDKPGLVAGAVSGEPIFAPSLGIDRSGTAAPEALTIAVWHGSIQTFGPNGDPQKWINIVGNVSGPDAISNLSYTLNGGPSHALQIGPDDRRKAEAGDFNIELDYTDLNPGANSVLITANDTGGASAQSSVTVNYAGGGISWTPQTLVYDWSTAGQVNDLAQVVDGRWAVDGDSIRPLVFDFDRLVALGDLSWRDYTVTVPVTVAAIDEGGYPAPSNGPGIGLMVRWNGHYDNDNGFEPRTGWRRLGAMAWYRWQRQSGVYTSGYQILRDGGQVAAENGQSLRFGTTYLFKLQVSSATSPATYRFKVWEQGETEPTGWMFTVDGKSSEPASGSVLLVAHHVDARFGPVTVELDSVQPAPQLTVPNSGGGGVQIDPQKASYRFGEDVTLTALPDSGTPFSGWSGDIYGTDEATANDNPLVVPMFGDRTIQAQFESCSSNSAPTAAYTFAPAEPVAGEPLRFTDESSGCPNSWKWDFGDGTIVTDQNPVHTFANPGDYIVKLVAFNDAGRDRELKTITVLGDTPPPPPPPPPPPSGSGETIYISPQKAGSVSDVSFAPADIVAYEPATATWSLFFDASDVALTANVNAFALLDDGSLLLAFKANQSISGLGTVTPQDVVHFIPASLGASTTGQFAWLLDGSTVGLTTSGERIDALAMDPGSGRLLLSTMGTARVNGPDGVVRSHDEDILAYDLTAGSWSQFFDGTPVTGLAVEDINGLTVDSATGDLYVVILGGFNLGGVSGNGRDIVRFVPDGSSYTPVDIAWDGSALGFPVNVDAVSLAP